MSDLSRRPKRLYRSRNSVVGAVMSLGAPALCVVFWFVNARGQQFALAAIVPSLLSVWRSVVSGIWVNPEGVKLVVFLQSRRIPWEKLERFEVMDLNRFVFRCAVFEKGLTDPYFVLGIGGGYRWMSIKRRRRARSEVDGLVADLNKLLADWRTAHGDS